LSLLLLLLLLLFVGLWLPEKEDAASEGGCTHASEVTACNGRIGLCGTLPGGAKGRPFP